MSHIKLLIPREAVNAEIETRIKEGQNIYDTNDITMDESNLKEMRSRYHIWDDYNKTYLEHVFDGSEIAEDYSNDAGPILGAGASLEERVSDTRDDVRKRISRLKSILARLSLYEVDVKAKNVEKKSHKQVNRDYILQIGSSPTVKTDNRVYKSTKKSNFFNTTFGKIVIATIPTLVLIGYGLLSWHFHLPTTLNTPLTQTQSPNPATSQNANK